MTVQGTEPQHLLVDCGKTFEEAEQPAIFGWKISGF